MFVLAASCCVGQCSALSLCLYSYFCIYLYMLLPFARISMYVLVAYCRGGQGSALSLCHMSAGYIRPQPTRRASVLPNSGGENTLGGKGRQRVAKKGLGVIIEAGVNFCWTKFNMSPLFLRKCLLLLVLALSELFWVASASSHDNFCRPLEDYGPRSN